MGYEGFSEQKLKKIPPETLSQYLESTGWEKTHSQDSFSVFRRPNSWDYEIVVSGHQRYADYARRMSESLLELTRFENSSPEFVLRKLFDASDDVFRLQIATKDTQAGTIPLVSGFKLVGVMKDALAAAACSVIEPHSLNFKNTSRSIANEFVKHCRFGQTNEGSFVMSFLCPLDFNHKKLAKKVISSSQPSVAEPISFSRRVTSLFMGSLGNILHQIRQGASPEDLVSMQKAGEIVMNADFLDAVRSMNMEEPDIAIALECNFSFKEPVSASIPQKVSIDKVDFSRISNLCETLSLAFKPPPQHRFFVGTVDVLRGDRIDDENRKYGEVVLCFQNEEKIARARLFLDPSDYAVALKAHAHSAYVKVSGTLQRSNQGLEIQEPSDFEIVTPILANDLTHARAT